MQIRGRGDEEWDTVNVTDDYFDPAYLSGLIDRLNHTKEIEQFLFRESELDCAFRQADIAVAQAMEEDAQSALTAAWSEIRGLVFAAHDLVGDEDVEAAADKVRDVIDLTATVPSRTADSGSASA